MALITVKGAAFRYENHPVLSGLSFSVEEGNYLCVVGENGSGKSTLVKGILGLKRPSEGSISYGGGLKQKEIGYLPQQTGLQQDFPASVREVVLSGTLNGAGWSPFYGKEARRRAHSTMEKLGIADLAGRCYRELSGGQQQRVLLARALCATRKLLLLDEPVVGLDPIVTQEMYALIRQINRQDGITVIMVSHDVRTAAEQATHILHIGHGPLFFGPAQEYAGSELGRSFLGGGRA